MELFLFVDSQWGSVNTFKYKASYKWRSYRTSKEHIDEMPGLAVILTPLDYSIISSRVGTKRGRIENENNTHMLP